MKGKGTRQDDTSKALGTVKNSLRTALQSRFLLKHLQGGKREEARILSQTVAILMMPAPFDLLNAGPQASWCLSFRPGCTAVNVARHRITSATRLVPGIRLAVSICSLRDKMFFISV